MTYSDFKKLVDSNPEGVVLMEGCRAIPADDADLAQELAATLAQSFPDLRFRSGNAEGTDAAFSKGVAAVDASRLQVVAPYASHRRKSRYTDARYDSPDSLSTVKENEIAYKTSAASPKNKGLISKRSGEGRLAAKAAYLIRDTMKVTGHSEDFPRPFCALFYVNLEDPSAGGTGHTIRVCQQEDVPCAFQDSWVAWLKK